MNNDLEVAHPHSGSSCVPDSWSNWNLEMLVFEERGKPEYPEKNLKNLQEFTKVTLQIKPLNAIEDARYSLKKNQNIGKFP